MVGRRLLALFLTAVVAAAAIPSSVQAGEQGRINVNTASVAELARLPGIGPARARQIVAGRPKAGYRRITDLGQLPGFGHALVQGLKGEAFAGESSLAKFRRVDRFAENMPRLMERVLARLQDPKLDRDTAVAAAIATMHLTGVRVGSRRYATRHKDATRGAATLRHGDVRVEGNRIVIRFPGKKQTDGRTTTVMIEPEQDPVLVPALARALQLFDRQPGKGQLLWYPGSRGPTPLSERQVLAELSGYGGWNHALRYIRANALLDQWLATMPKPRTREQAEANIESAISRVGRALSHDSPTTTRKHYIDPRRIEAYRQLR